MNKLTLVILLMASTPAIAGEDVFSPGFTVERDVLGNTVIRDEHGRRSGSIENDVLGNTVIRDEHGRRAGTIEQDVLGDTVIRDEHGRRAGTIEQK